MRGIVLTYGAPPGLGIVLVTVTSILQSCPELIVPPVQEMVVPPAGALSVPPIQFALLVAFVGLLMITPAGRGSMTEKFVRFVSFGAVRSILNLELPPTGILVGKNDLIPATSVPLTVTLALTGERRPTPCAVVKPVVGMVFVNRPEVVPAGTVT